jgi:aminoglycoside 6-adenylyltransferase
MHDQTLTMIQRWAKQQAMVRAVLLTSTRARPDAQPDPFSDYDIILAVTDIHPYFTDRTWLGRFGVVLVVYRDPIREACGYEQFAYITQYEHDLLKIDFTVMEVDLLRVLPDDCDLRDELDMGYQVLLDKEGVTGGLPAPTYQAYRPKPPTEAIYHEHIEVFFHEATYVAKNIWRDELLPAKYSFDQVMKQHFLREMLLWRAGIDHHWSITEGVLGKGLKQYVPAVRWRQLEETYVGADVEAQWQALFGLMALYREVAVEVGTALGFQYPHEMDRHMDMYLRNIRAMPSKTR